MKVPRKKPGKEYIRLSFAIFRAKKAGKDISELLAQRQKLISQRPTAKSREEINRDYYQKNRENLREEVRRKKQEKQEQEQERREREINELATKFYQANSIKVLASFKEYTELKKGKKLWLDLSRILRDCAEGVGDIISLMQLREATDNLIDDYWATTKGKVKKSESWNTLKPEQQHRLIKYWAREKFHQEQGLAAKLGWQENRGLEWERAIELAKFHEERGKKGCSCYDCQERKTIRNKVKQECDEYWKEKSKPEEREEVESDCGNCGEYKKVSVDSGLCRKCERKQEE